MLALICHKMLQLPIVFDKDNWLYFRKKLGPCINKAILFYVVIVVSRRGESSL